MTKLEVTIYIPKDGKKANISIDVLNREDATKHEKKLSRTLESYVFGLIKDTPKFYIKEKRFINEESSKEWDKGES